MPWIVIASYPTSTNAKATSTIPVTLNLHKSGTQYRAIASWSGGNQSTSYVTLPDNTQIRASFNGVYTDVQTTPNITTTPATTVLPAGSVESIPAGTNVYLEKWVDPLSAPYPLGVPSLIEKGKGALITWGSVSRATRYHLERSVNGGAYTQIYQGSNLSYTDTALDGWVSVTYRVCAYSSEPGYSSYTTSGVIPVKSFPEMKPRIDGVLKTSDMGWARVDGQLKQIDKVWERVDGVLKEAT